MFDETSTMFEVATQTYKMLFTKNKTTSSVLAIEPPKFSAVFKIQYDSASESNEIPRPVLS